MSLPGVTTVLKDRFYTLSRTDAPIGPRVCVVGSRNTAVGPSSNGATRRTEALDYDPYDARNEQDVVEIFGYGSQLHRAYLEVVSAGGIRTTLVSLPAGITDTQAHSSATVSGLSSGASSTHDPHIPLDVAFDAAETSLPDIIVPWGRGGDLGDWQSPATPGDDLAYGFYADNSTAQGTSLAARISDKAQVITDRSHPCLAVMGIKPFVGNAATPSQVKESIVPTDLVTHLGLANLLSRDTNTSLNGQFLSIVATEIKPTTYKAEWGYANGAASYAGFLSGLLSWSATTGKTLFNIQALRYNPTRTQQESLLTKGTVPVAQNFSRVPLWVDGTTWGKTNSDYVRLTTLRIVFDAVQLIREVAQRYVGEAATLQNRNALETSITAALAGMQRLGALISADFVVSYIPSLNTARVDLVLQPAFELRTIEITVSVQL